MTELESAVRLCAKSFDVWPLLVYPCKEMHRGPGHGLLRPPKETQLCPGAQWGMFFDLGIYGVPGFLTRRESFNPSAAFAQVRVEVRTDVRI
jgi:delta24-sterol reductase